MEFGFYNILWAAKAHLHPVSSTYGAFSTELPNTDEVHEDLPVLLHFPYKNDVVVYVTTTTASNEWKQPPDQGQTWVQYQRRCGKSQVNLTQLEVTLSLWQSTLGSPRPSKFPSHLLRADKDSPSFQRSHFTTISIQIQCLNPHGSKNFVGLILSSQEY